MNVLEFMPAVKKFRSNRDYTCPLCGQTDPTKQTVMKLGHEIVVMNCSYCITKIVISIVKEGVKEIETVQNMS